MTNTNVNNIGFVLSNQITGAVEKECSNLNNLVIFKPKDLPHVGTLRWFGVINNNFEAYGIEMCWPVKDGTNGTFNCVKLFDCPNECGIIVKSPINLLILNKQNRYIEEKEIENLPYSEIKSKYNKCDLVVIRIDENLRVGKWYDSAEIGGIECHRIILIGEEKANLFASIHVLGSFLNENGAVSVYEGQYNINDYDFPYDLTINDFINFQYGNQTMHGILKWKGTIDRLRCLGIDPNEREIATDYSQVLGKYEANWVMICLDNSNLTEVSNPHYENIYTYFKLKGYVKWKNEDGCVEKYFVDKERNFYYGVKFDSDVNLKYIAIDELKCASPTEIGSEAFREVEAPVEFGIETFFKLHNFVKVLPTRTNNLKNICLGEIVWMGFDQDSSFKFLIKLDDRVENGRDGFYYKQLLYDIPYGQGLLVDPNCIVPLDAPIKKDRPLKKQSPIVKEYVQQRYDIIIGKDSGIQGDKNSCYLDTSFFAMFTFQEVFDNILYATNDDKRGLQKYLREYIIFPLRKFGFVSFDRVEYVRQKLGEIFPGKMFVHSERDPEELLETLFHFLTPNDPLLNTFHLKSRQKQCCFLTQLFYLKVQSQLNHVNIKDMLDWTFLESDILMDKPPKCLILQLPRHGNNYKQFKEVNIKSKLDITHLIRHCDQTCYDCSKRAIYFCRECSDIKNKFTYYCNIHQSNCQHDKNDFTDGLNLDGKGKNRSGENNIDEHKEENIFFKGNVVLDLFAILCIDKTHYISYVKTGEVSNKWVFFDSMASSEGDLLHPVIREAKITKYLETVNDKYLNEDVQRIKQFAFVCFYKNPIMEFYSKDYNHIGE